MEQEQLDTLKERIYAFMREDAYRPLPEAELRTGLGLPESEGKELSDALAALEAEGAVICNRSGLYGLPSRMNLVVGRLSMSPKGFGFIIPDVRETEEETDVFVPGSAMGTAMHGDRVVARVTPSEQPGRAREGEIIRILERVNTHIVGTFERSKAFGFVTPDSTKIGRDVFVLKKDFGGAKTGSKVVVEITKWPEQRRSAEGRVVEVLGKTGDPGVDVLAAPMISMRSSRPMLQRRRRAARRIRFPRSMQGGGIDVISPLSRLTVRIRRTSTTVSMPMRRTAGSSSASISPMSATMSVRVSRSIVRRHSAGRASISLTA